MTSKLEGYTRVLLRNRRRYKRFRQDYDALVRSEGGVVCFRGRIRDISRGGARIQGLLLGPGLEEGDRVDVEVLVLPKDDRATAYKPTLSGYVCRLEDFLDDQGDCQVGIEFDQPLAD